MQRLIREHDLPRLFKRAKKMAASSIIAVPFWGRGAVSMLNLRKGEGARIICNLDSAGCNPEVIDEIRKLGIDVRTHPRLHAKIYATEKLAIVGSSNVSTNGLAAEGMASRGWIEANVASDEPGLIAEVFAFFDQIWNDSETRKVRATDIMAARRANRAPPRIVGGLGNVTLLAACRDRPDDFRNVYVMIYDEGLGEGARHALSAMRKSAAGPESGLKVGDFRNAWGYQYDGIPADAWLVDLNCRRADKPRYVGCARGTGLKLRIKGETDLTIAVPGMIRLSEGGPGIKVSAAEKASLEKNARRILAKSENGLLTLAEAIKIMDHSK